VTSAADRKAREYAEALVLVHGRRAPYFATVHALARRESGEPDLCRMWLAAGAAARKMLARKTGRRVH